MALQDRIEKIKQFFIGFNVDAQGGVSVLLVRFPQTWTIPDQHNLAENFGIQIEARQEGIYFITELENGIDGLFDAVDYVIEYNQSIIEKSGLLKEKISELKDIFIHESIDKLKTLQFIFGEQTTEKKGAKPGKKTAPKKEVKAEPVKETVEPVTEPETNEESQENDDNDLMSMAKDLVD